MSEQEEKFKKGDRFIKILTVIIAIFLIIVLFVIKFSFPAFPLVWAFIIGGILIVAAVAVFIFSSYFRKKKFGLEAVKNVFEKLPNPITSGELQEIAQGMLTNKHYANHLRGCLGERWHTVGKNVKNSVYEYRSKTLYGNQDVVVLINAHYPLDRRSILLPPQSQNEGEIMKAIRALGTDPESDPSQEIIERENPLLGTSEKITRITNKEEEKEKTKKQEDLE